MKLKIKEINVIDQVLINLLFALEPQSIVSATNIDQRDIEKIQGKIRNLSNENRDIILKETDLDQKEIASLILILEKSVSILEGFDDIHTLTGYEEEDIIATIKSLKSLTNLQKIENSISN